MTGIVRWFMFLLFASAGIAACKTREQIQYGYRSGFCPEEGEVNLQISKTDMDTFADCCFTELNRGMLNMAVNRAIKGKVRSYISLVPLLTPSDFGNILREDPDTKIIDTKEFGSRFTLFQCYFVKKNDYFVCRTAFTEFKYNELVIYDIADTDSMAVRPVFDNHDLLREKLTCGKNN